MEFDENEEENEAWRKYGSQEGREKKGERQKKKDGQKKSKWPVYESFCAFFLSLVASISFSYDCFSVLPLCLRPCH